MPQPKIKVAHFLSGRIENLSGGDLVVLNLLEYLDRSRFDPWVVSFNEARNPGDPLIIKTAQTLEVKTFTINARGRFDLEPVGNLRKFITENQIDILHCHGYKADVIGFLACRQSEVKKIATLHGWWTGRSLKLKFYNFLDYLAVRKFDKVIAVSEPIRGTLARRGMPPDRLLCIENGVDIKRAGAANGDRIRSELKLPYGKTVLGMVGRLSREKGHRYLFSAIQAMDDVILLVVGNGPLEAKLRRLAENLHIREKVVFVGFKPDVSDYLAATDIFVLPSLTEGLPLALLEAMAAGKPVVASDVGGIPTVIGDKKEGLLVRPKDPVALKEAITVLINDKDLAKRLTANAMELAGRRFSVEKMAKSYEETYTDIMG